MHPQFKQKLVEVLSISENKVESELGNSALVSTAVSLLGYPKLEGVLNTDSLNSIREKVLNSEDFYDEESFSYLMKNPQLCIETISSVVSTLDTFNKSGDYSHLITEEDFPVDKLVFLRMLLKCDLILCGVMGHAVSESDAQLTVESFKECSDVPCEDLLMNGMEMLSRVVGLSVTFNSSGKLEDDGIAYAIHYGSNKFASIVSQLDYLQFEKFVEANLPSGANLEETTSAILDD